MEQHQKLIENANREIAKVRRKVSETYWKPRYHVAPEAHWMNDPNGFIYYKGEYHLFYQHHPYSVEWGPMHWGHLKSKDLTLWEHLPIALAPSHDYDSDGCFSGSAIEKDGQLYLMYTGHKWTGENPDTDVKQVQCLAVSEDGITFEKVKENPIISGIPDGDIHPLHFRDPKVWKHENYYYSVIGSKTNDEMGQVLLYRSKDLFDWEFLNIPARGKGNCGFMWECPDMFHLNGEDVLMMSPQGVKPEGDLYLNVHQAGYIKGKLDYETGLLEHGEFQLLDYGFDFYAPQTMLDDQGRRIMIGWMAMWENEMPEQEDGWSGAMTLPRELTIVGNQMISQPVPELRDLRQNEVAYDHIQFSGQKQLAGIDGDCYELELSLDAKNASAFGLALRVSEENNVKTVLSYDVKEQKLLFDRTLSGKGPTGIRKAPVNVKDNQLHLRIFVDRSSIEVFVNGGEQVMTGRIYPNEQAKGIQFLSDNDVEIISLKKWDLKGAFRN